MTSPTLRLGVRDGVATVELNRPDFSNALDVELASELAEATESLAARDDTRLVVLRGAGRHFCVGGDIGAMAAADRRGPFLREVAELLHRSIRALDALEKPIISVVQGAAAGAGLGLVLASDLVIATDTSRFLAAFGGIGLTPDSGSSFALSKFVGPRRALELTLTGRTLSAAEALDWGLVTSVVPESQLETAAEALISSLSASAVGALGRTRWMVRTSEGRSLSEQLDLERDSIADYVERSEAVERINAFSRAR